MECISDACALGVVTSDASEQGCLGRQKSPASLQPVCSQSLPVAASSPAAVQQHSDKPGCPCCKQRSDCAVQGGTRAALPRVQYRCSSTWRALRGRAVFGCTASLTSA